MFLFYLSGSDAGTMYFLIGVWGGERRIYAAIKFVIYTVVGSLLMLAGIIAHIPARQHSVLSYTLTSRTITQDVKSGALVLNPND